MKITALQLTPVRTHREMGRRAPSDPEPAESRHVVVQLHTDAGVTGLGEMSDVPWDLNAGSRPEDLAQVRRPPAGREETAAKALLTANKTSPAKTRSPLGVRVLLLASCHWSTQ